MVVKCGKFSVLFLQILRVPIIAGDDYYRDKMHDLFGCIMYYIL
jgi:hypothetical protein